MRDTFLIVSDSSNIQSSNLGHLVVKPNKQIIYPQLHNHKKYKVELEYLKLPYSVCNISSAKTNNKFIYTYSGTPYTVTFPDGVYSNAYLSSYIEAFQDNESHYDIDGYGNKTYFFELIFNNSQSKSVIQVNKVGVAITSFDSTTFYDILGIATAQLPISVTTTSTNKCNLSQASDEFFVEFNICQSNYNTQLGGSSIFYNSSWSGSPWNYTFYPLPEEKQVSVNLRMLSIPYFEIKICNSSGTILSFASDTSIDSVIMRFSITDE